MLSILDTLTHEWGFGDHTMSDSHMIISGNIAKEVLEESPALLVRLLLFPIVGLSIQVCYLNFSFANMHPAMDSPDTKDWNTFLAETVTKSFDLPSFEFHNMIKHERQSFSY